MLLFKMLGSSAIVGAWPACMMGKIGGYYVLDSFWRESRMLLTTWLSIICYPWL